ARGLCSITKARNSNRRQRRSRRPILMRRSREPRPQPIEKLMRRYFGTPRSCAGPRCLPKVAASPRSHKVAPSMSKKIAVVQLSYIPWKGYFDLINSVDEFVLYDDAQYTIRDWRNRNTIKSPNGLIWLTIPVKVKGKYLQRIKDTEAANDTWARDH